MTQQNWRHLDGPVTVYYAWMEERTYASLVQAIRANTQTYYHRPRVRLYRDAWGLTIPDWKVAEVARLNPAPDWVRKRDYVFRQGPVPGVRSHRRWHGCTRYVATYPERRDNDFLTYDEDAFEHRIQARAARRPRALPTSWDDIAFARRGRGWKHHRAKQYRES